MSNRNLAHIGEHDNLVHMMINEYRRQGYTTIDADLNGFNQPMEIGGFRPDIIADGRTPIIICEAETCDTINIEHTENQFNAFANATRRQQNVEFHIAVPNACVADARQRLRDLGIVNVRIWSPS